jgi:hypothetical protein
MPKKGSADDKGVSCYSIPAVVRQRSSVAMLEAHRQHPVSNELRKRHYESTYPANQNTSSSKPSPFLAVFIHITCNK